jgi:benzylsuccinate CoA-transferase BbsE subunit
LPARAAEPRQASTSSDALLAQCRVLDLTGELGWLCGRIFADLGADVIKVEPPGGEPGRTQEPLLAGQASLNWLAFNVGKRSVTLDLETARGRELLLRLADSADFLLESSVPGRLDSMGLGWPELHRRNPRLILTSITPYGQDGPEATAPASDLEVMASGGAVWLAGDPDRPPVRITQPQAPAWTGLHAAMGTLIAHHFRQMTGRGQHVDVSGQASVIVALSHAPTFWDMLGENPRRAGPYLTGRNVSGASIRNIWACKDGYLTFAIYGGAAGRHSNRQLVAWMAERGMAPDFLQAIDWDHFEVATITAGEVERLEATIAPFLRTLTKKEFFEGAIARRILGYAVATTEDIAQDPQLAARAVWQDLIDPQLGASLRYPSSYALIDGTPLRHRRPAPTAGQHNQEILVGELGVSAAELAAASVR